MPSPQANSLKAGPSTPLSHVKDLKSKNRTSVACTRCRKKRVRCDGKKPRCTRCSADSGDCMYTLDEDRRKPPSRALVNALRARVAELESELSQRPSPPRRASRDDTSSPGSSPTSSGRASPTLTEADQPTPADLLAFQMESQLLITNKGQARIFGPTSPFLYDVAAEPLSRTSSAAPLDTPELNLETVAQAPTWFLPYQLTPDLHLSLLRYALTWATSFQEWVQMPFFLRDMVAGDDGENSDWSPTLHLAVLAHGAYYLHADPSHRDVDAGLLARTFMNAAKQRLILYEIESPGLATIRGIMLLAALINANGDDRQGWLLLGMATRLSEDSGLHLDPAHLVESGAMSRTAAIARKRMFWTFFILDQFWSIWLGRPSLSIWGDSVSLPEVIAEDDYSVWYPPGRQPELSFRCSAFRELAKIAIIIQKTMHTLFAGRNPETSRKPESRAMLDIQLMEWMTTLPAHLRINGSPVINPPHVLLLHAMWHSTVLLLHRPRFMNDTEGEASSRGRCVSAAKAILHINRQYEAAFTLQTPIQTMSLTTYLAGTVFLMMYAADPSDVSASKLLGKAIENLQAVGVTWPDAARCGDVLRKLQSTWCLSPSSDPQPPAPTNYPTALYNHLLQLDTSDFAWAGPRFNGASP